MHAPLRSALMALAATMLLVTASCSSTPEAAPSTAVSVTASAWVEPPDSGSTTVSQADTSLAETPLPSQSLQGVVAGAGSNPYFSAAPLPAGLSTEDTKQAEAAIAAYGQFWSLSNSLGANPTLDWTNRIAEVATGTAANDLQSSATEFRERGLHVEGQGSVLVTIERVESGAVQLALCVDGSRGRLVDAAGAPVQQQIETKTRTAGSARVGEYASGWKVDDNYFEMGSPC
ncbi:hypothetical protein FDO65_04965 [Nakamurella flava]|uniref:Lipoprotein n=1 Tax=Nakamurella flava TaxID=2576308 RepID=A0A4U6QKJ7_9ACTN|nr:hypothetical protein [Nakamurella flava]TKV61004.1 hypothetical protein FDO65_04965 [Nakamurella flava]